MSTLSDVASWFGDSENWQGQSGIPSRIGEHLRYSISAVVGAAIVAMPIAAWLGHKRRFGTLAINVANIGQTLPSFAILVLLVQLVAFRELPFVGPLALFLAMALLAIPPLFVNTYVGVSEVDDSLRSPVLAHSCPHVLRRGQEGSPERYGALSCSAMLAPPRVQRLPSHAHSHAIARGGVKPSPEGVLAKVQPRGPERL